MPRRGGVEGEEEAVKTSSPSLPPRLASAKTLSLFSPSGSHSPSSSFSPTSSSSSSSSFSSSSLPSLEALQVVRFVAVEDEEDILVDPPPRNRTFSPLFSHHFFKENECIVGYDELSILIYFSPDTFDGYVRIQGSVSKKAKDPNLVQAELRRNLFESIPYPGGFSTSVQDFLATVRKQRKHFKPPGKVVAEKPLVKEIASAEKEKKRKEEKTENNLMAILQLRECRFSDLPPDDAFFLLHRRVEWFFHWFIESASPIHIDCQWRVFLPYIVFKRQNRSPNCTHDGRKPSSLQGEKENDEEESLHAGLLDQARKVCEERSKEFFFSETRRRKRRKDEQAEGDEKNEEEEANEGEKERESGTPKRLKEEKDEKTDDKYSVLPVFAVYRHRDQRQRASSDDDSVGKSWFPEKKKEGRRGEEQEKGTPRGSGTEYFRVVEDKKVNDENAEPSALNEGRHKHLQQSKLDSGSKLASCQSVKADKSLKRRRRKGEDDSLVDISYHLAGISTVYTFYALTGFRRRISQFMVFPHVQRQGVGLAMMEHIYCDAILDSHVLELTVEEPASSFSQLRDVAGLKLLLDLKLLPRYLVYPREAERNHKREISCGKLPLKDEKEDKGDGERERKESDDDHQHDKNKAGRGEEDEEERHRSLLSSPARIVSVMKETPTQAVRLSEILQLASCLPHPLPPPPVFSREDFENRRDWREKKKDGDQLTPPVSNMLKSEEKNGIGSVSASSPPSSEQSASPADLSSSPSSSSSLSSAAAVKTSKSGGLTREDVKAESLSLSPHHPKGSQVKSRGAGGAVDEEEKRRDSTGEKKTSSGVSASSGRASGGGGGADRNAGDGEACRSIRLKVKRRLKKENLHWLIDLPALQQKEELQILWSQLYFKYYRTISKLRDMYPLLPDDSASSSSFLPDVPSSSSPS